MPKDAPNHVSLGKHQCPVCDKIHDHNAVVCVAKDLRKDLPKDITVGLGLCEEHDKPGFVAILIEAEPDADDKGFTRFGGLMHCKVEAFERIFEQPAPEDRWIIINREDFKELVAIATSVNKEPDNG